MGCGVLLGMNLKGTSEIFFCDENVSIYFTSIFFFIKTIIQGKILYYTDKKKQMG